MDSLTERMGARLAQTSSRRSFLRFAGGVALGVGLTLSGSSLAYADVCPCSCGGGPCPCSGCGGHCTNCAPGGGCGTGCSSGGNWNCCISGCVMNCAECCCNSTACKCFIFIGQSCGGPNCPSMPMGAAQAAISAAQGTTVATPGA